VYNIGNNQGDLPAVFNSKGSLSGDFYLDYTYIKSPILTTDYINWNTDTNKLPCIDPLKGREYFLYSVIKLHFDIKLLKVDTFELDIYFGSRANNILMFSLREVPEALVGENDLDIGGYTKSNYICDTNISNIYIDFNGSRPNQTVKLTSLFLSFTNYYPS
jgi:hypothetical protein